MLNQDFSKWVACWGNATSISDRKEAVYAKDITLRYPVKMFFNGSRLRFHFSNLTGTENVTITKAFVKKDGDGEESKQITFSGKTEGLIEKGQELLSDEVEINLLQNDTVFISLYFKDFTQLNAGTLVTGPLSKGQFCYGDFSLSESFPVELSRETSWFYFLNTIDIFTEAKNHALICYGDSITAGSWPDYLGLRALSQKNNSVSVIRRAVCGTRILREYNCITYAAYGLKGEKRFPVEAKACGAENIIIQHGINDIIHPVGVEVNKFRPWSDLPECEELISGVKDFYLNPAKEYGLKVWSGTLLPIYGWRTYEKFRDDLRNGFNQWLRTSSDFAGCVDFDKALRDENKMEAFASGFDSGDHLHPSEAAYKKMAETVPASLLK